MGQSGSGAAENYNEEELLRQLAEMDPNFRYTDYVDGNCTLQEVISIRQCFLDLREDFEVPEDVLICGTVEQAMDPPETVAARKLRSIPFLSNEEIMEISQMGPPSSANADANGEGDQLV